MSSVQRGFWDVEERLRKLSQQGDPQERLAATVDCEMFRWTSPRRLDSPTDRREARRSTLS